ncbi:hypothetical protein ACWD5Z_03640 [Micromonospora chokoriensis]
MIQLVADGTWHGLEDYLHAALSTNRDPGAIAATGHGGGDPSVTAGTSMTASTVITAAFNPTRSARVTRYGRVNNA